MTHSWDDVRLGDKIKVQHTKGGVIEGECQEGFLNTSEWIVISGLNYLKRELTILEHKASYQDGDIGVLFHSDGTCFVGVYDSKREKFYANNAVWNTTAQFGTEYEDIKIVGNVKELA